MTETMTLQDPQGSTNPRKKWVLIGAGVLVALLVAGAAYLFIPGLGKTKLGACEDQ